MYSNVKLVKHILKLSLLFLITVIHSNYPTHTHTHTHIIITIPWSTCEKHGKSNGGFDV